MLCDFESSITRGCLIIDFWNVNYFIRREEIFIRLCKTIFRSSASLLFKFRAEDINNSDNLLCKILRSAFIPNYNYYTSTQHLQYLCEK